MNKRKPTATCSPSADRAHRAENPGRRKKMPDRPLMTLEDLVLANVKKRGPYSLRWGKEKTPKVVFQLEYDTEVALYAAVDSRALAIYAEALRRCWSSFGIGRGDCVGIFDYGTSPVSYLASSIFTPYLRRGAADILGCLAVCNDGVANLSRRAVDIVKYARPRVLFVRSDCLHPFAAEVTRSTLALASYVDALVAVANEALLSRAECDSHEATLGVPIYRLARADAAMFLAPECRQCGLFHVWQDLYHVETAERVANQQAGRRVNRLVITNRFSRSFPSTRYLSQINAVLEPAGCPAAPKDIRMSA